MKKYSLVLLVILIGVSLLQLASPLKAQAAEINSQLVGLTTGADSIVVGKVVELDSFYNDNHSRIYTSVVISAQEYLKGALNQTQITFTVPGGQVEEIKEIRSDVPNFILQERVLVFLKTSGNGPTLRNDVGMVQVNNETYSIFGGINGKLTIWENNINNLSLEQFKRLVSEILLGSTAFAEDFEFSLSPITSPYLIGPAVWPHPPAPIVSFRINENISDCTGEGVAVQDAASTWNAAGALFTFSYAGPTAATSYGLNGVNEICWNYLGADGTVALASTWVNTATNTLVEFDIEFNDYYWWSTSSSPPSTYFDVWSIALHELGHAVGLKDLYNSSDSAKVMYGYVGTGTKKRVLHADDIAGIRYIYGSITTPTVINASGASNITSTSARLNGEVTSTGDLTTTVHVYWGQYDGGTNPANWANDINLGAKPVGAFYADIGDLTQQTTYYYRCYVVNSAGGNWANSSSFTTKITTFPITLSYSVNGGVNLPSAPMLTYTTAGAQKTVALSPSPQVFSADDGTTWSISSPSASSPSERWQTNQATTGTVNSSQTTVFVFFHQYRVTFGFNIIGGGTGYTPPTIIYQQFGSPITPTMGTQLWADSAPYTIPDLLVGSSSFERWVTDSTSGAISTSGNFNIDYYHQFITTASYSIIGGGTPGSPIFTSTSFGSPLSQSLTTQAQPIWIDNGASYSLPNILSGSSASERWQSNTTVTGNIASSSTISTSYYHQYLTSVSYSIVGGGTPGSPIFTSTSFGSPLSQSLTTQAQPIWIDNGASYSLPNTLSGSSASERWQPNTTVTGNIASSSTILISYDHQFYVTINLNPVEGGSISVSSGWFDADSSFQPLASANTGWQFNSWQGSGSGSYSGSNSNALAVVKSPITETATFYPGLTITTMNEVSVSYSYGAIEGYAPAGTLTNVFAPQGTNIQLTANPKLFIYKFDGWGGSSFSNDSSISIALNSPSSIIATYSYNYVNIGIVAAVVVAIILGLILLVLRTRRSKRYLL